MAKMTEDELRVLVQSELENCIGLPGGKLSEARREAMRYYEGLPFGNEVDGRSQVVLRDVAETVEWIKPSLMRVFTAGDEVVRFEPQNPQQEGVADQATDYINYIFNRQNEGFLILHNWFTDALIQRIGVVKAWWEETEDESVERYQGLTEDELALLASGDDIEVTAHRAYPVPGAEQAAQSAPPAQPGASAAPQPPVPMLHDVELRRTSKGGKVCIKNVPPDEFLIARRAVSLDDAPFVCHRVRRTASDLLDMGYSRNMVDDLPAADEPEYTPERIERFFQEDEWPFRNGAQGIDPAMKEIWISECYVKCDFNGDGRTEWRKIVTAGQSGNYIIMENDEWPLARPPFYTLTPIIIPHKLHGLSIADLVMDLQFVRSTIMRQTLDNLYLSNAPRMIVGETTPDSVNYDDLLRVTPGGIVRTKNGATVTPIAVPFVGDKALAALEYLDQVRENRTGVAKNTQGLEADQLTKTATGTSLMMGAAQQRIELIARIFAETGVKDLFKGLLELVCKYQDKPAVVRLRGEWVPMDPREWDNQFDVSVNVGLGTGNKDQQLTHLMTILQIQQQALVGGLSAIVTPENLYNAMAEVVKNAGLKTPEKYFTDPKNAPPQQQGQQKPDPKMIEAQGKLQIAQQQAQNGLQIQHQRMQGEMQLAQQKAELDHQLAQAKLVQDMQLQRERISADIQLKQRELEMEAVLKREQMMLPGHAPAETAIQEQTV